MDETENFSLRMRVKTFMLLFAIFAICAGLTYIGLPNPNPSSHYFNSEETSPTAR